MRRRISGYFTVEAALVLPMVFMMILMLIYLLYFQYNRCLMEQDVGILAVRGAVLQAKDNQNRMQQLKKYADNMYREKYIAWNCNEIELKLQKGRVCVSQKGWMVFPFCTELDGGIGLWEAVAEYDNHIMSPVSFIRNYRKIMGG